MSEEKKKKRSRGYDEKCLVVRYALEHGDLAIEELAKTTGIERTTLYRWLKRVDWDLSNLERLRHGCCGRRRTPDREGLSEGVRAEICGLLDEHPGWGPLKIKHYFWRHRQELISQRRIYRFLKEEGVIEARRKAVEPEADAGTRRFEAGRPLELVQMDCMRLELSSGQVIYLVTMLDDHSRFIIRSRFVPVKTMEATMLVLREGVKEWGLMDKVLTDQGSEFVSWHGFTRFEELLSDLDVELIVAASHHPQTVGKLERFHATLRAHLREYGPVDYGSQAQLAVREFVSFYNYERPHEALDGLVPADRFFGVSAPLDAELEEYRQGHREGQQLYLCCRLGDRRIVLSGPRSSAVEMYANGKRLDWEDTGAQRQADGNLRAALPAKGLPEPTGEKAHPQSDQGDQMEKKEGRVGDSMVAKKRLGGHAEVREEPSEN